MTPVAAIVFSAHDRAFLRAVEATDALVVHPDQGRLAQGPQRAVCGRCGEYPGRACGVGWECRSRG